MKKIILKSLLLLIPFLFILGFFIIVDPLKAIHDISDPTSSGVLMNDRIHQANHLNNHNSKVYNGFIFGSSRSKAFKTVAWKAISNINFTPYHMGVNDETLYGIERKFYLLDSLDYTINHALIILDPRILSLSKNHEAHIFREHYMSTGETKTNFYQHFFKAFLNIDFLKQYVDYKMYNRIDKSTNLLWNPGFTFDKETGDIYYSRMDSEIKNDSINYYLKKQFPARKINTSKKNIGDIELELLNRIKGILDKHKTKYSVILSPNYDLTVLCEEDINQLNTIFAKKFIFDYSMKMDLIGKKENYYEYKHFKPYIANTIMQNIYNQNPIK